MSNLIYEIINKKKLLKLNRTTQLNQLKKYFSIDLRRNYHFLKLLCHSFRIVLVFAIITEINYIRLYIYI